MMLVGRRGATGRSGPGPRNQITRHRIEVPNPAHPFGARGAGDIPILPPTAAIANAIHKAVGVRLGELPVSPQRVLEALWPGERRLGRGSTR